MVRHILKKDLRLLWPVVAALTAFQALLAVARFTAGQIPNSVPLLPAGLLVLLTTATMIALVVHQDPIPGTRQDWLTRPIRRRDLLLAKLLFVLVFVQGPWFVIDLVQGVANGFAFGQSAAAAAACAAWVLVSITLPVLAFAALTATLTELVVAALGTLAIVIGFFIVRSLAGVTSATALTGLAWVPTFARQVLLLAAAIGVLMLQYGRRDTWPARMLFAAAVVAGLSTSLVPWRPAFLLQQAVSARSDDDRALALAFAPGEGRFRLAPGQGLDEVVEKPEFGAADVAAENQRRRAEGARTIFLPIRVTGLAPDSRLLADHSEVVLIDRQKRPIYRGKGNDLELRATGAEAAVHQGIRVPGALFSGLSAEPLDVAIEYSLTLFRPAATYAIGARDGEQRMPGIGLCSTIVNDAGTRVFFRCLQPGERPPCLDLVLEHTPTRQRNPAVSMCAPDYSPFAGHTFPDALSRFMGSVPFYDPAGTIRYPVGGPELADSRLIVTDFRPTGHFVRQLTVPAIRLQDWEPRPNRLADARFIQ